MTRQEWINEAKFYERKAEEFRADGDESMAGTMQEKANACYANASDARDEET